LCQQEDIAVMYPSLEIHSRTSTPSSHNLSLGMGAAKARLMLGGVGISNASIAD